MKSLLFAAQTQKQRYSFSVYLDYGLYELVEYERTYPRAVHANIPRERIAGEIIGLFAEARSDNRRYYAVTDELDSELSEAVRAGIGLQAYRYRALLSQETRRKMAYRP